VGEVVVELVKAIGTISEMDETFLIKLFVFLMFASMILIVKTMR
jgi:hypothetical protein